MSVDIKKIPACVERAMIHAFKVQLSTNANVASMTMHPDPSKIGSMDCLSTIMLASTALTGSLSLGFSTPTFLKVLEKMIGETYSEITSENCDASSEILNIIYGQARREINECGFDFELGIPSTVIGKNLAIAKSNLSGQVLFFNCSSELGDFVVVLSLKVRPTTPQ